MPTPPSLSKDHLFRIQRCIPTSWKKPTIRAPIPSPWKKKKKKKSSEDPLNHLLFSLVDSIKSLSSLGHLSEAFTTYSLLRLHSPPLALVLLRSVSCLLHCSTSQRALLAGEQLHAHIVSLGFQDHPFLVPKLTSFYAALDLLVEARAVVEGAKKLQTLPWNLLIWAYIRNGLWQDAIFSYKRMVELGVWVNKFTYPSVLRACGEIFELDLGREVHRRIGESVLEWDLCVWNSLVGMYAKCNELDTARKLFDGMVERDVITWNSMISGYALKGMWEEAFELLQLMPETSGVNTVTWNAVLVGNLQMGNYVEVIRLISQMGKGDSMIDFVTLVIGLKACSKVKNEKVGKEIHGLSTRLHCDRLENIINALITMYFRCRNTADAYILFRMSTIRSVVTWNSMLAGYRHMDQTEEASLIFREMIGSGVQPNYVTVLTMISLSARIANLQHGRELHCYIIKQRLEGYELVQNSLVDMYSKSGRISSAHRVFDTIRYHDKIPYTSLILGYGIQGEGTNSLKLFNEMISRGIEPDHITMVAILSACSHSGLVVEGQILFDKMVAVHGIIPRLEHFSCMVDLYSQAGLLRTAEEIIDRMPLQPSAAMLATLIEACRIHGNINIGERAAKKLLEMRSDNPSHYVVIQNMYASARCWQELAMVRSLMIKMGLRKGPSHSWLHLGYDLYPFQLEDNLKQQEHIIFMLLEGLSDHMRDVGFTCNEEVKCLAVG
ncbi:pentatricopeptide repeat-containing protein At1g71490 isoform X1 [Typha angustifolia]|uniref:pentatricopeptide repeat-containing protein At1g71490 isoform X1 n=1 Tax=Typha angustifolia TaxID=59011 RepID=UPI003C2EE778